MPIAWPLSIAGGDRCEAGSAGEVSWATRPQADVKPVNQLLGTNPGSPSCRIVLLCVGLVFSVAASWQGLLVCLMNIEMGGEEAAREVLQIASEEWH